MASGNRYKIAKEKGVIVLFSVNGQERDVKEADRFKGMIKEIEATAVQVEKDRQQMEQDRLLAEQQRKEIEVQRIEIEKERRESYKYGGRTVFGDAVPPKAGEQLGLF